MRRNGRERRGKSPIKNHTRHGGVANQEPRPPQEGRQSRTTRVNHYNGTKGRHNGHPRDIKLPPRERGWGATPLSSFRHGTNGRYTIPTAKICYPFHRGPSGKVHRWEFRCANSVYSRHSFALTQCANFLIMQGAKRNLNNKYIPLHKHTSQIHIHNTTKTKQAIRNSLGTTGMHIFVNMPVKCTHITRHKTFIHTISIDA